VCAAALAGNLAIRAVFGAEPLFVLPSSAILQSQDYGAFVLLGLGAAVVSVVAMRAVTAVERNLRTYRVPGWARPIIGGSAVGLVAFFYSEVLGSGHGAIASHIDGAFGPLTLLALLIAKILASALTVGSGMRGGLFSTSLFLGTIFGSAVAATVLALAPSLSVNPSAYALVGMAAVAAGIVGAPVTMILLVLETTGNFSLTVGVMAGVITCTVAVRQNFGYSFATWRFHVRGIRIRGAHDIGWIAELTVGKLMRKDIYIVPASETVAEVRKRFPLGGPKYAFVIDGRGSYIGTIETVEAHSPAYDETADETTAELLIRGEPDTLEPQENIRTALILFSKTASEILPVVDSRQSGRVVGSISEAYALRRYTQELEKQRLDEADGGVFSPDGV
jgi:CIC family chloride channel protein